jgi:hypothetical protein
MVSFRVRRVWWQTWQDAKHKITPTRCGYVLGVWFRAQRVWEAFVEKVDKEYFLLVMLTNRNRATSQ